MPYVLEFAGVLLFAEIVWRIGLYGVIRLEGHGIENLYVIGMDELLAKDAAFFHDNFAGSLTKRVLSFASRFEDASVVLWRYDPLLVAGLLGLIAITGAGIAPLIRRRQKLVDQREEAIARVSGHVADSLMNMDTIRAFAAEDREAAEHRSRVADQRRKSVRSWDYENLRIDTLVGAPLIEAMLHSPQGLAVRRGQQPMRRAMFEACADSAVPGARREVRDRAAAVLQVLYSAASWEFSPEGAFPIIIEHHVGSGAAAPLHVHHDVDDSFYLLSGQLAMRCGDDTFAANAGDYVSLPKGVPHALSNVGAEEAVLLQTHDADSFLTFIRRVGIPSDQPQPDPATLDYTAMNTVAGQTGQPVLGPPMSEEEARAIIARSS